MESSSSSITSKGEIKKANEEEEKTKKPAPKKARGYCVTPSSSSHTQFFRKPKNKDLEDFERITRDQYYNITESISSDNSFKCVHGPEGKQYTPKGLLKRNLIKNIDPRPFRGDECAPLYSWDVADKIEFLIVDTYPLEQLDRLQYLLREFAKTSRNGYRVDVLHKMFTIVDFLIHNMDKEPVLKEHLIQLLKNFGKPTLLIKASDVVKYFDSIRAYLGFMGYLLILLKDDEMFTILSKAVLWHISAPDSARGKNAAQLRHTLTAGRALIEIAVRMLAVAKSNRFPTFLEITLLLACDAEENCIHMMKENIIENIFYRFNPYFPGADLPTYDINPADCQDMNLVLGDSGKHMNMIMSLLLVLVKTMKQYFENNPSQRRLFPYPDRESFRCFMWAYRYECRARGHHHERNTLTVIVATLLKCFGSSLTGLSLIMGDVMTLSVLTEIPLRDDWTRTVNFSAMQYDVQFKKILIHFSVDLLITFPFNKFMVESRYWLLGLMYLIDPGLGQLKMHWSAELFNEIRKSALQALVIVLPICDPGLVKQYQLIRRLMWYIEWYSDNPYEIGTLYWCMRLLQATVYQRKNEVRKTSIGDLFDTHGVIILVHLCLTLLDQKLPPVEKSQAVLAVCLRLLTSTTHGDFKRRVSCVVYNHIKWPNAINHLGSKMMNVVLYCLERNYIVSDRWLIALLNFIWEAIIWVDNYRALFVRHNGIYNLLDIVTMTRYPVQCIALALICDVARSGKAVGHLVTWRASIGATNANPRLVKRGATIASLLAAVFRDECIASGVSFNEFGVIEDKERPLMTGRETNVLLNQDLRYFKSPSTPVCLPAGSVAGSRMSKAFALLHMLSEDLAFKVSLTDETYHLYKNIQLKVKDETMLVLCSHYLTLKLCEVWSETKIQSSGLVVQDEVILDEFLNINKTWVKDVRQQQNDVVERYQQKERDEENSLYAFLGRIRLNIALDALKVVRCVARSADRDRIRHSLLHDAVFGHHRREIFSKKLDTSILQTFKPQLDEANMTGQNVKVLSIRRATNHADDTSPFLNATPAKPSTPPYD